MSALSLLIRPTDNGWGVYLSDGHELMRYRGLCAKRQAIRYLRRYTESVGQIGRSGRPGPAVGRGRGSATPGAHGDV